MKSKKSFVTPYVPPSVKFVGPSSAKTTPVSKQPLGGTPKSKPSQGSESKKDAAPKLASSNISRRDAANIQSPEIKTAESPQKPQSSSSQAPPKVITVHNPVVVSAPSKHTVTEKEKEKPRPPIIPTEPVRKPSIENEEPLPSLPPPRQIQPASEERVLPPPQPVESEERPTQSTIVEELPMCLPPPQQVEEEEEEEEPAACVIPVMIPCAEIEEREDPPMLPVLQPLCEEPSIRMAIPPPAWEEDECTLKQELKPFIPLFDGDGDEDIKDSSEDGEGVGLLSQLKTSNLKQLASPSSSKTKKKASRPRKPKTQKLAKGDVVIKLDEPPRVSEFRSYEEPSVKALPPREEAVEEFRRDDSWSSDSQSSLEQVPVREEFGEDLNFSRKIEHERRRSNMRIIVPVSYDLPVRRETYSPEPQIKQQAMAKQAPTIQPHQLKSRMIEEELEETVDNSKCQVNFDIPKLNQNPRERFRAALEQPGTMKLAFEIDRDRHANPLRVMLEHEDGENPKTVVQGVCVDFDSEPDDAQVKVAQDIITCLSTRRTALCETGKRPGEISTVLSAALGWLSHEREHKLNHTRSKIIVLYDRNPDRIISAIQRLKIKPRVTMLGTRDSMCTNTELEDFDEQTKQCKCLTLVQGQVCSDFNVLKRKYTYLATEVRAKGLFSTEDIGNLAASHGACPYFLADAIAGESQLLIASIEHLAQPHLQSALAPHLANSILIVEEAGRLLELGEGLPTLKLMARDVPELSDEFLSLVKHLRSLEEFSPQAKELGMKAQDLGGAILELNTILKSQESATAKRLSYKELTDLMIDLFLRHRPDFSTLEKYGDLNGPLKHAAEAIPNAFFEILAHVAEKPLFLEFGTLYRYAELLFCLASIYLSQEKQNSSQEFYAVTLGGMDSALSLTPLSAHLCLGTLKANQPWSTIFCSRTTSSAAHLSTEFQLPIDCIITSDCNTSGPVALALASSCGAPLMIDANSTVSRSVANELGQLVTSALAAVGGRTLIYLPSAHVLRHIWGSWKEIVPSLESTEVLAETDVTSEDDSTIRHFCSDEPKNIALLLSLGGRLDKQILSSPPVVAQVFFVGLPLAGARSKSQRLKHFLLSRLGPAGQTEDFLGYRAVGDVARRLTPHPAVAPSFGSYLFLDSRVAPGSPWETYLPAWVRPRRVDNTQQALSEWRRLTSPLPGMLISLQHADITMITETAHTSREMWLLKRGDRHTDQYSEEQPHLGDQQLEEEPLPVPQVLPLPATHPIRTESISKPITIAGQGAQSSSRISQISSENSPLEIVRIYSLEVEKLLHRAYIPRIKPAKSPNPLYPFWSCTLQCVKLTRTRRTRPIPVCQAFCALETAEYFREGKLWKYLLEENVAFEPSIQAELSRIEKVRSLREERVARVQAELRERLKSEEIRLRREEQLEMEKIKAQEAEIEKIRASERAKVARIEAERERIRALKEKEEKEQEEIRAKAELELEQERKRLRMIETQKEELRLQTEREKERLKHQLERERTLSEQHHEKLRQEHAREKARIEQLEHERTLLEKAREKARQEQLEGDKIQLEKARERARLEQEKNRYSEIEEVEQPKTAHQKPTLRSDQEAKLEALANLARTPKSPIPKSPQKFIKEEYIAEEEEDNFEPYIPPALKNSNLVKEKIISSPPKEIKNGNDTKLTSPASNQRHLIQSKPRSDRFAEFDLAAQLGKRNENPYSKLDIPQAEKKLNSLKPNRETQNVEKVHQHVLPSKSPKELERNVSQPAKKPSQAPVDSKIDARNMIRKLDDRNVQKHNTEALNERLSMVNRLQELQNRDKSSNMHALIKTSGAPRETNKQGNTRTSASPAVAQPTSKIVNIQNFLTQSQRPPAQAPQAVPTSKPQLTQVERDKHSVPAQPPTSPAPKQQSNLGVAKLNDLIKMVNSTSNTGTAVAKPEPKNLMEKMNQLIQEQKKDHEKIKREKDRHKTTVIPSNNPQSKNPPREYSRDFSRKESRIVAEVMPKKQFPETPSKKGKGIEAEEFLGKRVEKEQIVKAREAERDREFEQMTKLQKMITEKHLSKNSATKERHKDPGSGASKQVMPPVAAAPSAPILIPKPKLQEFPKCMVCRRVDANNLHGACRHVACPSCWLNNLRDRQLVCPKCQLVFRKRELTQVQLPQLAP